MYELVRENLKECADYAHIKKLIFIDAEIFKEETSDEFESFFEYTTIEEMLEMFSLGSNARAVLIDALDDGYLPLQLSDLGCNGFLAQINMPIWRQFQFDEAGEYKSCLSTNQSQLKWIYGSTIEKLVNKMKIESEKFFDAQVNEARKL
jgi:hypothetical protein